MEDYVSKFHEDLKKKVEHLCSMHIEPTAQVAEYFAELKRQVDLDAERLLSEIQSVKYETENSSTYINVNKTRLEFIRILEELEKRTGLQLKPEADSSEAYASLEKRVDAFKDSSSSMDELEDSYVQLACEIIDETEQLERRIFGEQTVIYLPSSGNQYSLGSIMYFGDTFLRREDIELLMRIDSKFKRFKSFYASFSSFSSPFAHEGTRLLKSNNDSLLVGANEPDGPSKSKQVVDGLYYNGALKSCGQVSKFFYIGKTAEEYSGYSAQGSSVDREFVSYTIKQETSQISLRADIKLNTAVNLFDVFSSSNCKLKIESVRLEELPSHLLPSPVTRLTILYLNGVHFESFDTHLLATCTKLTELRLHATFSKNVKFELAFLGALRQLTTLELTLPNSSTTDLNAIRSLKELKSLKLKGLLHLNAEKPPRLSKEALEQILSAPRLESLELVCFEIEAIDREMLSKSKHLSCLKLTRNRMNGGMTQLGFLMRCEKSEKDAQDAAPFSHGFSLMTSIDLIQNESIVLNAASFAGMACLSELLLTDNSITDLPRGVFQSLSSLTRLFLDKNRITHIRRSAFDKLDKLKSLSMDKNPIESIESFAFFQLQDLEILSLRKCQLKSIDSEMFVGLTGLMHLDLGNNLIERIEVIAKDGRRINVAKANLSEEEKHVVKKYLFRDSFSLNHLDLRNNKLEKLDLNCFYNLRCCQYLFLSSNMMNELSGEAGTELLSKLVTFKLNDNQLTAVDKKSIPKSVCHLDLSKNKLERLDEDFFKGLTQLKSVNLAENQLTMTITEATFDSCKYSLEDLDLSQNESISITEGAFRQMERLSSIDYDLSGSFADIPLLTTLRLRGLTSERLQTLQKLKIGKPHICLGKLEACCITSCSIKSLERNSNREKEAEINRFSLSWLVEASRLEKLDFSENLIETLDDPELFADFKGLKKVNLSCNRLSRIHREIFKCLTCLWEIDLSNNKLSSVEMGLFRHVKHLLDLDLSSNNIAFFNLARLLRACPSLCSLNLADNQLDDRSTAEPIEARSSCHLRTLVLANNRLETMDFVREMTSLDHLDLRGNKIESVLSHNGENLLDRLFKLTYLNLSRNRICSPRDEMFAHLCDQLADLDLSENPLDTITNSTAFSTSSSNF